MAARWQPFRLCPGRLDLVASRPAAVVTNDAPVGDIDGDREQQVASVGGAQKII